MKTFFEFVFRQTPPGADQMPGLSYLTYFTGGSELFILLGALVGLVSVLVLGLFRPHWRFLTRAYYLFAILPLVWGLVSATLQMFGLLDSLAQMGWKWNDGIGDMRPLADVLSEILVFLLTGTMLTVIFLLCGPLFSRWCFARGSAPAAGTLPDEEQRKQLCEMIYHAFVDLRHLSGEQANDLADAFHNLPLEIYGWGIWSVSGARSRLNDYQQKHGENLSVDYFALLDKIYAVEANSLQARE